MQPTVIDKPYRFIPPNDSKLWPRILGFLLLRRTLRQHGVESYETLGVERLKASVDAGHGVLLAANHVRPPDPLILYPMGLEVGAPIYAMASWHLFMSSRFLYHALPFTGVFSVYREGLDRDALKCAVRILAEARRPLVLFPEGVMSRSNDHLNSMMDGTVFIARNAARQRAAQTPAGKVVVHPVAIRYFFRGDVRKAVEPVLEEIERRLSWRPRTDAPLKDRIVKVGEALLTLKELEYGLKPQSGTITVRIRGLMDHLLIPLEDEWLKGRRESDIVGRVKALRSALLPEMVADKVDEPERARRWKQLADIYLAQQLALYPPDYFSGDPTPERLLETVERLEEDLTDKVRVHRPFHAVAEVGEAMEVPPGRDRGAEADPIMTYVRTEMERMLDRLRTRGPAKSA